MTDGDGLRSPGELDRHDAMAGVDDAVRATLARLADVLIPAGDGMPSASEAGVAGPFLDDVLRSRPDLTDALVRLCHDAANEDPVVAVAQLRADGGSDLAVLETIVPGGYFMNPEIRSRIGYPGQQAVPVEDDHGDEAEEAELLRSVRERGTIYRDPGA